MEHVVVHRARITARPLLMRFYCPECFHVITRDAYAGPNFCLGARENTFDLRRGHPAVEMVPVT